jgi:hypothetical protein
MERRKRQKGKTLDVREGRKRKEGKIIFSEQNEKEEGNVRKMKEENGGEN